MEIFDFNTKENFYLGVIYHQPKSNITNFILAFDDKLIQLGKRKYYIVGDFNININNKYRSEDTNMYLNMLSSNGALLPIDKHIRVIVDRVITKDIPNTIFPRAFL